MTNNEQTATGVRSIFKN